MKRIATVAGLAAWLTGLALVALAQDPPRGMRRWYDPKTEVTIRGVVERVNRVNYPNSRETGISLTVRGETGTFNVRVGPTAFVEKTMTFKDNDKVEIVGSKVTMMGKTLIIAREVKNGDKTLTLRNKEGTPLWRGTQKPIS